MENLEKQLRSLPRKKLSLGADFTIRFRLYREIFLMDAEHLLLSFNPRKGLSLAVLIIFFFSSVSVYAYGSPSVSRGHSLYPIKHGIENIEIGIAGAFSDDLAIDAYVKMAQRRVDEYVEINEKIDTETDAGDAGREAGRAKKTIDEIFDLNHLIVDKTASLDDGIKEKNTLDRITDIQLDKIATVENRAINEDFRKGLGSLRDEIKANRANFINEQDHKSGGEVKGVFEQDEKEENDSKGRTAPLIPDASPRLPAAPKIEKPISIKQAKKPRIATAKDKESSEREIIKPLVKRQDDDKQERRGSIDDSRDIKPSIPAERNETEDREDMPIVSFRDNDATRQASSTRDTVKIIGDDEDGDDERESAISNGTSTSERASSGGTGAVDGTTGISAGEERESSTDETTKPVINTESDAGDESDAERDSDNRQVSEGSNTADENNIRESDDDETETDSSDRDD